MNDYFDGAVKSIAFTAESGSTSVSVMNPEAYVLSASQRETMQVISVRLTAKLTSDGAWEAHEAGSHFDAQQNNQFEVKVEII
ncbi:MULTISPECIES: pyrimidine/purine nucleoside phosphorylase [unclassified Pseudomonas]|nr:MULTISPECIES: pyrimidine/purine nucleoside phosphorylase [unclassified Pseudomonas]RAU43819.1 DUF1255 family protein [Pseudomonas sp. RIT 409]RAU56287.1 DUF1255 family protein [Pseudomonas sp. RIT 412]